MTDTSPAAAILGNLVAKWKAESSRRKQITSVDPVADAIDYCAGELDEALKDAMAAERRLTVEEYAAKVRKSPQTVRAWCRRGKIKAERTPTGYLIPVAA